MCSVDQCARAIEKTLANVVSFLNGYERVLKLMAEFAQPYGELWQQTGTHCKVCTIVPFLAVSIFAVHFGMVGSLGCFDLSDDSTTATHNANDDVSWHFICSSPNLSDGK